jgi:hypothetical protein
MGVVKQISALHQLGGAGSPLPAARTPQASGSAGVSPACLKLEFTLWRTSGNKLKLELQLAAGTTALPGLSAGSVKVIQCFTRGSTCSKRRIHASNFATLGLNDYCDQKTVESYAAAFSKP